MGLGQMQMSSCTKVSICMFPLQSFTHAEQAAEFYWTSCVHHDSQHRLACQLTVNDHLG